MKPDIKPPIGTILAGALAAAMALGTVASAQDLATASASETDPPFGGGDNVAYAEALWSALGQARLVGPESIITYPYGGTAPHGKVLEYLETEFSFEGHTGVMMVKKNYAGEGEFEELEHAILNDRMEYLDSVTIMFRREQGYDPDHGNWFWAKYAPDGSLANNPQGMALAGRVAKGADQGCIACHQRAEGEDYVYTHDRFAE